jgi:RHS repeat-associated protein
MHFTGKQRDTETNNDYFGVRYFGSNMGRFLTPDLHAPSLTNPQSWNKYAYAFNNPLRLIDPNGSFPTDAHILWTTAALNQLGFSNAAAFASTVNKVVDIDHFLENELHAMSGAQAYQGFRYGLLSIATNPCSGVGCSGAGESAVALVLGLHLVQDRQAHEGIESLLDHFFRYGFGDADPNSEAGKKAQDETQKFLADFKHLLVANLGEEGAADALLKMQAAAAQLTGNGVKQYVTQIYKELTVNVPTQDPQEGPIWFKSQAQQEAQRQCELGNQAACGN